MDFSGINLTRASIYSAFAEGLNLRNAVFEGGHVEEDDFSRADFRGATFRSTTFNKTILTGANLDGATFVNRNQVNLVGALFRVKEITETVVYGIAAWDLVTSDEMKQSKLVIEKTYEFYSDLIQQGKIPITVDDIELAQFVYYLNDHKKMRDTLNILNDKGVLLLGRFKDGGLERLYSICEWLQRKGYMAMIFDFARPDNLSLTETVVTMAGRSKFIFVDLPYASVPAELQAVLSQVKKPLLASGDPYALYPLVGLEANLSEMEKLHGERIMQLARRYDKAE
jgi:uncharacterized protein YjbI with pentapeptide repeats